MCTRATVRQHVHNSRASNVPSVSSITPATDSLQAAPLTVTGEGQLHADMSVSVCEPCDIVRPRRLRRRQCDAPVAAVALATRAKNAELSLSPPIVRTYIVSASGDDTEGGDTSSVQLDLGESTEVAVTFRGVSSDADDNGRILALDQAQLIFVCRNVDSTTLSLNVVGEAGALGIVSNASVWDTTAWGAKGLKFSFDATTIVQELLLTPLGLAAVTLLVLQYSYCRQRRGAAVRTRLRTMDTLC